MAVALKADIKESGVGQGDLVKTLNNIILVLNEIQDDQATNRTELLAIGTSLASVKAKFDAHTHESPGSSFTVSRGSLPDTGSAENSLAASAASVIADTSGSSVPATLTNGSNVVLTKG